MNNPIGWHDLAFEIYRRAKLELDKWKRLRRSDLDYWLEELEESLLDLKEATINEDSARAWRHMTEVNILLAELESHREGN